MHCPRCDGTLHDKAMGAATVQVCAACTGTLVRQADLVPLLHELAGPTMQVIDPHESIDPIPDPGKHLPCPICGQVMDAFGYMGSDVVIVDRCGHDAVIWADAGELGVMSVLYARSNDRLMAAYDEEQAQRDAKKAELELELTSRERADRVAGAMLTGAGHVAGGYGNVWQLLELLFGRGVEEG